MKPTPSDHFPLEISVELGRIRLRDATWMPSRRVPSCRWASGGSEVQLVSDNRVIARAELVVAGGELAVRLLSDVAFSPCHSEEFPS